MSPERMWITRPSLDSAHGRCACAARALGTAHLRREDTDEDVCAGVRSFELTTQNFERTVFAAPRPTDDILFRETSRRRIGPIFRLTVSGNF